MSNHNSDNDNINSAGDNNVTDSNSRANILDGVSILHFLFLQFLYNIILKIKYLQMKCHSRI